MLDAIQQSKAFNEALESGGAQPRPFYAEDLVRGYRLDVWDSRTSEWHSLHRRTGTYAIGDEGLPFDTEDEEGLLPARGDAAGARRAEPADKDLYVHEVIARWAGWSLSVPFPGKALSRYGDPDKAIPPDGDDPDYRTDEPITPFKVRADLQGRPGLAAAAALRRRATACARARSISPATASAVDDAARRHAGRCHGPAARSRRPARICATSRWPRRWS